MGIAMAIANPKQIGPPIYPCTLCALKTINIKTIEMKNEK
jgi:hypothetical protein